MKYCQTKKQRIYATSCKFAAGRGAIISAHITNILIKSILVTNEDETGMTDMMIHKYEYDADNRITRVWTSSDGINWDRDAKYYYYMHGPLARVELGHNKVQGIDYAYTIQGWLKGINSETLVENRDIGKDANQVTGNLNRYVAPDEVGYSLGYFAGDYSAINTPSQNDNWLAEKTGVIADSTYDLYNGNISQMVTAIRKFMQGDPENITNNLYRYDQLNRLTKSRVWKLSDVLDIDSNSWNNATMTNDYGVNIGYDPNSNIMTLTRNANVNSTNTFDAMDDLEYVYEDQTLGYPRKTNKLLSVQDNRNNTTIPALDSLQDIKAGQDYGDNYAYDDIGNLIEDKQAEIQEIEWTVYSKVKRVTRFATSIKPDLEFEYDPMGNRLIKRIIHKNSGQSLSNIEEYYYLRDAQGHIMNIYSRKYVETGNEITGTFALDESEIYGSSRIGSDKRNMWMVKQHYDISSGTPVLTGTNYNNGNVHVKDYYSGQKYYEVANHLGNVLAVVSDKRIPVFNTVTHNFTNFDAIVMGAQNFYPFGSLMPKRNFNANSYRFGFGGHEKDDEVHGVTGSHLSFGDMGYDPRIVRRWRPDPLQAGMPSWSPYVYALNNPIVFVDEDGKWPGVTYMYFELDVGLGLSYGLNYVEQSGIAYDEVGKTHFIMTSALYIANQNLSEENLNPEIVAGISASLSGAVTQDWSNETFIGDISGYNGEMGGFEVYDAVGGEIGVGEDRFSVKVGIGAGVKLSVINTQVKQSISLTDKEAGVVNDATDVVTESWIVNNRKYDSENNVWTGTVATRNTKGELIDTGIQVSSANVTDNEGTNAPSGVWLSSSYRSEAAEAEKK